MGDATGGAEVLIKRPITALVRRARGDMTRTSCPIRHWRAGPSQRTRIVPGLPSCSVSLAHRRCVCVWATRRLAEETSRTGVFELWRTALAWSWRSEGTKRQHEEHHQWAIVICLPPRDVHKAGELDSVQVQYLCVFPTIETGADTDRPDERSPVSATGAAGIESPMGH